MESSWTCNACTFKNSNTKTCSVCHTPKGTKTEFGDSHLQGNNSLIEISDDEGTNDQINGTLSINYPSNREQEGFWKCRRCTLLNKNNFQKCQVCESPLKLQLPTVCNLESTPIESNSVDLKRNEDLESRKKPSATNSCDNYEEWTCQSCTFSCNPSWTNSCQTCGKDKLNIQQKSNSPPSPIEIDKDRVTYVVRRNQESEIQHSRSMTEWNCSKCTLRNQGDKTICSVCRTPKNEVKGWECSKCTFMNQDVSSICAACKNSRVSLSGSASSSQTSKLPKHRNQSTEQSSVHPGALKRQESCLAKEIRLIEEKEAYELRQRIIQHCKLNKETFIDDSFPPAPKSLFCDPSKPFCTSPIRWCQPHEISVGNRHDYNLGWVVYRTPLPEDISQGILGNCWFLSALAVLAERRHLVENIILTDTVCQEGVYHVRLYKDGMWKSIIIDSLLPCNPSGQLVFSKAKRKQLWVPLIEKAMAKLHGSYEALVAGNCIEGLSILTGAPCESIPLQRDDFNTGSGICPDFIWAKLLSCRDMKFLMGASCGGGHMKANKEEFSQVGLHTRHTYSILDIQVVEGNKLIRLRNPWGCFSWKGKWSDNSDAWNTVSQSERHGLMAFGEEQGVFWMEFSDLMRYFNCIDICKVLPEWHETHVTGLFPFNSYDSTKTIKLHVSQPTEFELGLFQESSRGRGGNKNQIDLCIAVTNSVQASAHISVGSLVTHTKRQISCFVGGRHMFDPGEYFITPLAFQQWDSHGDESNRKPHHSYVLSIHSSKKVVVEEITKNDPYILADTVIQLAVSKGKREELRQGLTAYSLMNGWAGMILVVENRHPKQAMCIECDCSESSNIVSTRGTLHTKDILPPFHRQVVMIITQLERMESYHIGRRIIHYSTEYPASRKFGGAVQPGKEPPHTPPITKQMQGIHSPRKYV